MKHAASTPTPTTLTRAAATPARKSLLLWLSLSVPLVLDPLTCVPPVAVESTLVVPVAEPVTLPEEST